MTTIETPKMFKQYQELVRARAEELDAARWFLGTDLTYIIFKSNEDDEVLEEGSITPACLNPD